MLTRFQIFHLPMNTSGGIFIAIFATIIVCAKLFTYASESIIRITRCCRVFMLDWKITVFGTMHRYFYMIGFFTMLSRHTTYSITLV